MNYQWFVGIDVSKSTLDISILEGSESKGYFQISNTEKEIKLFLRKLAKHEQINLNETVFCMEHTGIYNAHFLSVMEERNLLICLESSVHIKQSGGLQRGKNDKIDSYRIAVYAFKNKEFLKLWQPERRVVKDLRRLIGIRERLLNARKQLKTSFKEDTGFESKITISKISKCCRHTLKALELDIKNTDEAIEALIESDEHLKELFSYIESVPGVGKVTAAEIVINTNEFKRINNPRKYACYAGIAPFEHSSGTSVRGKTRTSKKANMKAKSLLHMASLVAARFCTDLREYYERKVGEGKNKMNVLNAVKNKIIHRIFACVNQKRIYSSNYNFVW
ncbi:MAG TPA: IS110 family transposase [Ferruginibacter sp.]|nr:IS110 family transposase [Ferruginibacter sp.]